MARRTPFSVGQRWYCEGTRGRPFHFVIVGPGNKPWEKRCRVEPVDPSDKGCEQSYSHKHIKKYAKLVEET